LKTYYVKAGHGDTLVLLHGASPGACSLVSWSPVLDGFAEMGFEVFAFDQPGYGLTDNPQEYSFDFQEKHARAFLDLMGGGRYHALGNSRGGNIAARLALEDPRLDRLIISGTSGLTPAPPEVSQAAAEHSALLRDLEPSLESIRNLSRVTIRNTDLVTDELVRLRYEMASGKNREAQLKRRAAAGPRAIEEEFRGLRQKLLVLWGMQDGSTPVEAALPICEAIPTAEAHLFNNCGHWPQWDHPQRYLAVVRDFLTKPG
jgi:pimeloyl-ACP methyl ester carboxylesterase